MRAALLIGIASVVAAAAPAAAPEAGYRVAGTIAGPDGGWDYARVDPATHLLYIARTAAVSVIDLADGTARSIGTIAHGHAALPIGGGRVLVTSGDDDSVRILDGATGTESARIAVGRKPDAAILDPTGTRAVVMTAKGGTISIIDLATMKVTKTIAARPGLEYAAFDRAGTLFVNNEGANAIETVDLARGTTGAPIALPGCDGPTGLGYDDRGDRLIAACANGVAAVVDPRRRRVTATIAIGHGPDAVIVDAARRRAFVPCGSDGVLDIIALDGARGPHAIGRIKTEAGARTGALDPSTGALYLPTAKLAPAPGGGRPGAQPGTFHVVIVRPA